jgi:hypothetical protein
MYGYWSKDAPVRISGALAEGPQQILATSWVRHGVGTLIAIGSWNPANANLTHQDLSIDWAAIGLQSDSTALVVPVLDGFNDPVAGKSIARQKCDAASMSELVIPVSGNKGWVLWLLANNAPM